MTERPIYNIVFMGLIPNTVYFWRKKMKKQWIVEYRIKGNNAKPGPWYTQASSREEAIANFWRGHSEAKHEIISVYTRQ